MGFNVPRNSMQCTLEWKTSKIQTWRAVCGPRTTHTSIFVFYRKPLRPSFHTSFRCIASILGVLSHTRFCRSGQRAYGFDSHFPCGAFSRSSHPSNFKIGTPVAALPGAWRYRVSAGNGRPGVSIPRVWSAASVIVWQHTQLSEQIRPWDTPACCWDVMQPTNNNNNNNNNIHRRHPSLPLFTPVIPFAFVCLVVCSVWGGGGGEFIFSFVLFSTFCFC